VAEVEEGQDDCVTGVEAVVVVAEDGRWEVEARFKFGIDFLVERAGEEMIRWCSSISV
jgi:hypothetical protein